MRWPAALLLTLLVALPSVPLAGAQMTENGFTGNSHLRLAYGDVPLSPAVEPDGRWNAVEYHRVHHSGGALLETFDITPGFAVDGVTCTCGNVTVTDATAFMVSSKGDVAAGDYVLALSYHMVRLEQATFPAAIVFRPLISGPWTATLYLRQGQSVYSRWAETATLPGASHPEYTIHSFGGDDGASQSPVFELNSAAGVAAAPGSPSGLAQSPWAYAAAAFILGALVWAFLVRQGIVQKRTRRQAVAVAAHDEAGKEPTAVLEGRKRALMAALKEVELAKMGREMDNATYDVVKADLKRQTVAVMRALEAAPDKKPE